MPQGLSERKLIVLLATVQFVNILDFMMVMPLGPDFALALGIPTSRLGVVAGSYTAAAAVAGIIGALFLDRFDRKRALAVAMLGLAVGTASGALAHSFAGLVGARILAGTFGGPASAVAFAILTDVVPPERRGKAMGAVFGAFSAASVLGVPAGLRLALLGGWRAPFIAVACLGLLVVLAVLAVLPPMRAHLDRQSGQARARPVGPFLADRGVQLSLASTAVIFMGLFALVSNLWAFLELNLGYPNNQKDLLYAAGGVLSFFGMRIGGAIVDRRGALAVTVFGTLLMAIILTTGFIPAHPLLPIVILFPSFMLANGVRSVALNALASKVPPPAERARFMSAQITTQHMSAAVGAMISSLLLHERPDKSLEGIPTVALMTLVLAAALPFFVAAIDRRLRKAAAAALPAPVVAGSRSL
jgi:predicted MFS family arabinose efflux permease